VELLELIGGPEAEKILRDAARGEPLAPLTTTALEAWCESSDCESEIKTGFATKFGLGSVSVHRTTSRAGLANRSDSFCQFTL